MVGGRDAMPSVLSSFAADRNRRKIQFGMVERRLPDRNEEIGGKKKWKLTKKNLPHPPPPNRQSPSPSHSRRRLVFGESLFEKLHRRDH